MIQIENATNRGENKPKALVNAAKFTATAIRIAGSARQLNDDRNYLISKGYLPSDFSRPTACDQRAPFKPCAPPSKPEHLKLFDNTEQKKCKFAGLRFVSFRPNIRQRRPIRAFLQHRWRPGI